MKQTKTTVDDRNNHIHKNIIITSVGSRLVLGCWILFVFFRYQKLPVIYDGAILVNKLPTKKTYPPGFSNIGKKNTHVLMIFLPNLLFFGDF
jgi:hypothetical protein